MRRYWQTVFFLVAYRLSLNIMLVCRRSFRAKLDFAEVEKSRFFQYGTRPIYKCFAPYSHTIVISPSPFFVLSNISVGGSITNQLGYLGSSKKLSIWGQRGRGPRISIRYMAQTRMFLKYTQNEFKYSKQHSSNR